jgi:glycosyltransferase involved in cell wall biosynthesis
LAAVKGDHLRILVLNYEYPPVGGGGGRFAAELCRHLAQMGHSIRVLTGYFPGLPKVELRDGVTIYRPWSWRRQQHTCSVGEMGLFLLFGLFPALRQARRWRPHLMQAHFAVPTGVLSYVLHLMTGIPYVLSSQLGDVPGGVPVQTDHLFKWLKPLTRPIWRKAARVTVPSSHIRTLAQQAYPEVPMDVVFNGIRLEGQLLSDPNPHRPVRLIFAGRFSPQKNLLFLIDVLRQVKDLEWQLEMLGDGPEMPRLREQVARAGLAQRVTLTGWVAPDRVTEIMSRGDLLVLPSLSEGLPLVGVQALAAGLAILGSDVGGIADVVHPGRNGFLCQVNDAPGFVQALGTLLTDQGLLARMKAESRRLARVFDIRQIAAQFDGIFRRAVTGK